MNVNVGCITYRNAGGQVFYWVAMTFFFFCILLELRNPIWKRPFNRLYYIYIFPLNCVSITTISYHGWVNTNLTKAMAAATLIIASVATFLVFAFSAYYFFKNERIFFDLAPAITQPVATLPSAELHAASLVAAHVGNNALAADLLKRAWGVTPLPEWRTIVALIGSALPVPDAVGFFGFLARTLPEYSALVGAWLYESIEKEKFDVIVGAAPELVPAGTPGYAPYWS
eukprot:tig00000189_g14352.t1